MGTQTHSTPLETATCKTVNVHGTRSTHLPDHLRQYVTERRMQRSNSPLNSRQINTENRPFRTRKSTPNLCARAWSKLHTATRTSRGQGRKYAPHPHHHHHHDHHLARVVSHHRRYATPKLCTSYLRMRCGYKKRARARQTLTVRDKDLGQAPFRPVRTVVGAFPHRLFINSISISM